LKERFDLALPDGVTVPVAHMVRPAVERWPTCTGA